LANLTSFEVGMSESELGVGTDPINGSHYFRLLYLCESIQHSYNMKLDATDLRYVTSDEFRVLTAVSSSQSPMVYTIEMF
jgi:hypothetical protein